MIKSRFSDISILLIMLAAIAVMFSPKISLFLIGGVLVFSLAVLIYRLWC